MASAPIESKVVYGSWATIATGVATWMLETFIPAWHQGIPADLQNFLPVVIATTGGTLAAYLAKHTPRLDEALVAAFKVLNDPKFQKDLQSVMPESAPEIPSTVILPGPGNPPEPTK